MADIATAYVQIVPSARGLKGNLEKELDGSGAGEAAGEKAGSSFFSKMKSVLVAAGVGKMVTEVLKKSIGEGAALEQSLGGVETLFKENAATVIENAKQAYQTAGMSANEYMEQVTSFSASLLQSMGGNTAEAASVADMAMRDMSDNANKFGTDIDSITNAYQGFAKQNYTMLDNLKLGYGGTKSEMERLLADAQELTGVEYDLDNLSDVYNAIHAVQEELGVTGTTAKEASSTLSGSLSSMKAAFSNVMGNLALGEEMGPSLEALASTAGTFLTGNLIPMVWNIVTAIPGSLMTFINAMLPGNISSIVTTAIGNFSTFVTSKLPTILSSGVQIITEMANGFLSGLPEFLSTAGELLDQLLEAVLNALPSLLSAGEQLISNMASGVSSQLPAVASAIGSIVANLLSTLASSLPDILAMGVEFIGQLIAGALSMLGDIVVAAAKLVKSFCDTFKETDWKELGTNIIDGIKTGISNAAHKIVEAAKDAANRALQAAKDALGIQSPSRVFRDQVGVMIARGMALGITDGVPLVERAMDDLTDITTADMLSTVRIGTRGGSSGTGTDGAGYMPIVQFTQNVYSRAQSAAELMQEARYQAEMAVLMGV